MLLKYFLPASNGATDAAAPGVAPMGFTCQPVRPSERAGGGARQRH